MRPLVVSLENAEGLGPLARAASQGSLLSLYLCSGTSHFSSRYSFLVADPLVVLRCRGNSCFLEYRGGRTERRRDPWAVTEELLARFAGESEMDLGLPAGGCFGYWGYHMKDLVEPSLHPVIRSRSAEVEPDCVLGFFGSLVVHDQRLGQVRIISTGLDPSGRRSRRQAESELDSWKKRLDRASEIPELPPRRIARGKLQATASLGKEEFVRRVLRAQAYIRAGDIYQANLSYPFFAPAADGWSLFEALHARSPAPFGAWLKTPGLEIASSSPEQFLRMSGEAIRTRPIKGTRPRVMDDTRDAQLAYELHTSAKENAELVMITDLLRNDLGKVCEFGSVRVPELARLERFSHVQHLVSTVEGRLRPEVSHLHALKACFPGGSITGAPKFRAMQIIDELETFPRGVYTGALGYIGFNHESQLSIVIRTAVNWRNRTRFNVGSGIVADSVPEAEYDETLAKAEGFFCALRDLELRSRTEGSQP